MIAGHDLGLALAQGIARSLDDTIDLVSEPPDHGQDPTQSREEGILIVEDEDLLRDAVSRMLRKKGFTVIEANDGSAAINLLRARKHNIRVILLDLTLPGASSREVFAQAKRLIPNAKVILTSAYSEETATDWLGERADYFIRKPFGLANLVDLARRLLSA
jgi:DNA-binding response OmpR family regulator